MRFLYIILSCLFFLQNSVGQIYSPDALSRDTIEYGTRTDSIFFFKADPLLNDSVGTLEFSLSDTTDSTNVQWYIYRSNVFELIQTDINVNSCNIDSLPVGLYRALYEINSIADSSYIWISVLDTTNHSIEIQSKNGDGYLLNATCEEVNVEVNVIPDFINVIDPSLGYIQRPHKLKYNLAIIPDPDIGVQYFKANLDLTDTLDEVAFENTFKPYPYDTTTFTIELTDAIGNKTTDIAMLKPIHPKAMFDSILVLPTIKNPLNDEEMPYYGGDNKYNTGAKDDINSAPLTLRSSPTNSKNAFMFIWDFGDTISAMPVDTTHNITDTVEHTYYLPNEDAPYIFVLKTLGPGDPRYACIDTISREVYVNTSDLGSSDSGSGEEGDNTSSGSTNKLPNVFTPNGDGINDIFRIYDVSIKEFEITIFNRYGRIVHKYKGPDIREWVGWDGYIRGTNQIVPTGVYFYVVKALGYDGEEYEFPIKDKGPKKGIFGSGSNSDPNSGSEGTSTSGGEITGVLHVFSNEKEQKGFYK